MGNCLPKKELVSVLNDKTIELLPEERAIIAHESQCVLSKKDFKSLLKSIKSESIEGSLSLSQLKRAFSDLEIPSEELSSPDSATFKMFSRVKTPKKLFDLKKLSVLAILMGSGKLSEKSEFLFRQYDADASDVLELSEFSAMLSDIIEVAVKVIPAVAIGEGVNSVSKEEYQEQTERLYTGKEELEKELTAEFVMKNAVNREDFLKIMTKGKFVKLLSSSQVREMLRNKINS